MFFSGLAAVSPFLSVIAKQIGINATALGIGLALKPIFAFLSSIVIGLLVDYLQNIKAFLIVLLIISSTAYCAILSLPPINETNMAAYIRVSYSSDLDPVLNISQPFERSCLKAVLQNDTECELDVEEGTDTLFADGNITRGLDRFVNISFNGSELTDFDKGSEGRYWVTFHVTDLLPKQIQNISILQIFQCLPALQPCSLDKVFNDPYSTYQFWAFFILVTIGAVLGQPAHSLSSVACLELLGTKKAHYGRQRLYGTISYGLVSTLTGLLNDNQTEKSFISGVYILSVFIAIDIVILCAIPIPKAHVSSSMGRDLWKMVRSKKILVFSFGNVLIGVFNTMIYVFEFWLLEDMGATRTLMGLSVFMQCLVGEVPFLFFSGWFVKKLGHFLCFAFVFLAFFVRLLCYYLLNNPWLVLPVDILHGVTFGVYHGTMASFANANAPKGMEATLLGFLTGLHSGLGMHFICF